MLICHKFNLKSFYLHSLILLFLIAGFPFTKLFSSSIFEEIEKSVSNEEQALAGLNKLSNEEKIALDRLLFKHPSYYFLKTPKIADARDFTWVYEAKLLNNPPPLPVDPYSENNMIYDVAICTIFQNEAPWLKEWIEFHKLIGVQHFYLYNNLSTDNYIAVLEPYIKSGEVELIEWPTTNFIIQGQNIAQNLAYENALQRARGKARWLAIIDSDEFIVPVSTYYLTDFLKDYEQYGGVAINWQMYGTSGVKSVSPEELMVEALTKKFPSDHGENWFVKSIVKPHRVANIGDPHFCCYINEFHPVDSMHIPPCRSQNHRIPLDKIRINHYWYRTEDYYYQTKAPRRITFEGHPRDSEFVAQHMALGNSVEDKAIFKYLPALKQKMGINTQ